VSCSVIIPACNEENYLGQTLASIAAARAFASELQVEVIVVDNASSDRTASIAASAGATVVEEPVRNIALARNKGAAASVGAWLVFIDADTIVPEHLLQRIATLLQDPGCIGGAADAIHNSNRMIVRLYLQVWRVIGLVGGLAQGAVQFCRRESFEAAAGYDESLWMGEDVDFYLRIKKLAKRNHQRVQFMRDVRVQPSPRRFDHWSVWEILLRTNPLFILLFRRRRGAWKGWYDQLIR
jgi:glycosyltransferase involved in cell wall biosynthesis